MRLCALLVALIALGAPVARAQPPPHRAVVVTLAAPDEEATRLDEVLRELLGRLEVELSLARVERIDVRAALTPDKKADPALGRAWVDFREGGDARVILVDGRWERAILRVVERGERSNEVMREEIALLIHSASETLLAGEPLGAPSAEVRRELGLEQPQPRPPPPKPIPRPATPLIAPEPVTPPLAPPPAWRVGAGLYYEGQGYAAEQVIVHGPGLAVDVDAPDWTLGPGLELTAQYRIPFEVESEVAKVRLQGAVLRFLARLTLWRAEQIALQAAVGAGIDVLHIEPSVNEGVSARAEPERTRIAPLIRPAVAARVRLFGDTALWLGFAGDIDLIGVRYVVRRPDGDIPLVDPLRFRPSLIVGVSTTLAGGDLFLASP